MAYAAEARWTGMINMQVRWSFAQRESVHLAAPIA
jgi:hypothetical protein